MKVVELEKRMRNNSQFDTGFQIQKMCGAHVYWISSLVGSDEQP